MPKVKYVGPSHFRELTKGDFAKHGVTDQDRIYVAGPNLYPQINYDDVPYEVEVTDAAAKWLMSGPLKGEFKLVSENDFSDESADSSGEKTLENTETASPGVDEKTSGEAVDPAMGNAPGDESGSPSERASSVRTR